MIEDRDGSILCSDFVSGKLMRWSGDTAAEVVTSGETITHSSGVAIRDDGALYVTDYKASTIYLVQDGKATKLLGGNGDGFAGDGGDGAAAKLNKPLGLAIGPDHNLYIADGQNSRIRRWHPDTKIIETVVGAGSTIFAGTTPDDGLKEPVGLTFDEHGDLYIADSGHNQIKRVEAAKLK